VTTKQGNINFLGLRDDECSYVDSRYVVLPIAYERTTTYGRGTASGPRAIITASCEVELYDEELRAEPYLAGVYTAPEFQVGASEPATLLTEISQTVQRFSGDGKFVIALGGEHTVSVGPVEAHAHNFPELSILQIDAHADLRKTYQDDRYSHACTMKRIRDIVSRTVGIGIRNVSADEAELIARERIPMFMAADIVGNDRWHDKALEQLTDNVYLTIDLDGFDPSVIPGIGTPEPGGLGWYETLAFLRKLCDVKKVIGFDVVELMPIQGNLVSEFTAAKLIYKLIGYMENSRSTK
jgi:agmatinase